METGLAGQVFETHDMSITLSPVSHVPRFFIAADEACRCTGGGALFGDFAAPVTISPDVPPAARPFCAQYEAVLRRLFKECSAFDPVITFDDGAIGLNTIDRWSSHEIAAFLASPSRERYESLYQRIRRDYSMRPDVITLIVCRNLGVPAKRLVGDDELAVFRDTLNANVGPRAMHLTDEQQWMQEGCEYILLDLEEPIVLQGQTSPFSSAVTERLLYNKHWTGLLLTELGCRTPPYVLVADASQLSRVASSFDTVVFKPIAGTRRMGVVGPVSTAETARLRACFARCIEQITSGPPVALAQQYIDGTTYRINVNHGRVTFALQSVRNEVVGDGASTVEALLAQKRLQERRYEWAAETFVDNVLVGAGRARADVPRAGERVIASQDGTEGGTFLDVTDTFDPAFQRQAVSLAERTRCPVMGIDAIVDAEQRLWIVDVNPIRPTSGNVRRRAYDTIEHMVTRIRQHVSTRRRQEEPA